MCTLICNERINIKYHRKNLTVGKYDHSLSNSPDKLKSSHNIMIIIIIKSGIYS